MVCPFLDRSDPRCATHLTLANITRAFAHCADRYCECPVHRQLVREMICDGHYEKTAAPVGLLAAS